MYRWFNRATGISDADDRAELTIEKDETLWCTPQGQVCELNSRTVFSFTPRRPKALAAQAAEADSRCRSCAGRSDAAEAARRAAASARLPHPPPIGGAQVSRSRTATTYAVETEPGIQALVYRLGDEQLDVAAAARTASGPCSTSRTSRATPSCATSRWWRN